MIHADSLLYAIARDDPQAIRAFASSGSALSEAEAALPRALLTEALAQGRYHAALALLDAGANLTRRGPGREAPLNAILALPEPTEERWLFIELMLERGAAVNLQGAQGRSALHVCAALDLLDPALALIRFGADLDALDLRDQTPLMTALASGQGPDVASALIGAGARLTLRDVSGSRAADLARARGEDQVARAIEAAIASEILTPFPPPRLSI